METLNKFIFVFLAQGRHSIHICQMNEQLTEEARGGGWELVTVPAIQPHTLYQA